MGLLSCNPYKKITQGDFLLTSNTIKFKSQKTSLDKEELLTLIKQKPNKKVFGFWRFHLGMYTWGISGKSDSTKFKRWLQNIGEAPVLLDSFQLKRSVNQMKTYLHNKGYFNAEVYDSVVIKKKQAAVFYNVEPKLPYTIRSYKYEANDTLLLLIARSASFVVKTIVPGELYDTDKMETEREKITREMKMKGFYFFEKAFIKFEADTSVGNHQVDVKCIINQPLISVGSDKDSLKEVKHRFYRLGKIFVDLDFQPRREDNFKPDTLSYNGLNFIYYNKLKFKPSTLNDNILLRSGRTYQINQHELTLKKISDLKTFRFVNIGFEADTSGKEVLHTHIHLTPSRKQNINFDTQGTNTSGNLGVSANIGYQNRNALRGAELLEFKILGGLENQISTSGVETRIGKTPFNTLEFGSEANINIPKFVLPFGFSKLSTRVSSPKTQLRIQAVLQQRPDFTRNNLKVSYGINFRKGNFHRFFFNMYEINRVNVYDQSPQFVENLIRLNDRNIQFQYQPHFSTSTNFTYQFTNQRLNRLENFSFLRVFVESSGSTVRFAGRLLNGSRDTVGNYLLFGIPFSHFVKVETDFRYYMVFNSSTQFVSRFNVGIGVPFSNLGTLPYENNFFGGGANGIRAWNFRRLGPGSEPGVSLDQFGDTKIEANFEYRFGVYKFFKMALFTDIGNVWFNPLNNARTERGTFRFSTFYKELAVGAGTGFRLDFSFFVIRLDAAIRLRNPVREEGQRWLNTLDLTNSETKKFNIFTVPTYQIGIGYPF